MMAQDRITLDAAALEQQIKHLFAAYPELEDDETLRLDVLEGETDLESIAARIVKRLSYAEGNAEGVKTVIENAQARKARFEREAEGLKTMLHRIMDAAHEQKLTLPQATVSITKPRESVDVTSLDELPQGYFTTVRQADKKAIGAALKEGQAIPGAALKTGQPGLLVRRQ